jgi:hypothetical protein
MDLPENGKCLFTSLQYVESSHAPYQRIRFFLTILKVYPFLVEICMGGTLRSLQFYPWVPKIVTEIAVRFVLMRNLLNKI